MKARIMGREIEVDETRMSPVSRATVTHKPQPHGGKTGGLGSDPAPSSLRQSFFIPGPLPGMNDYISTGSRFTYNKDKKKWRDVIVFHIRDAKIRPMQRVAFSFVWAEKGKRRDPDNFTSIGKKFILDALVSCGILENDGWGQVAPWYDRWYVDVDNPGVWVHMDEVQP